MHETDDPYVYVKEAANVYFHSTFPSESTNFASLVPILFCADARATVLLSVTETDEITK